MKIIKGTTRIALVGKSYTVKIARVPLREAIRELIGIAKDHYNFGEETARLRVVLSEQQGPFRGIWANYREWQSSSSLGENVVPTRFSFLGILNVIDTAESLLKQHPARFIREWLGNGDTHTFNVTTNYGWHRGKLKLLDYGEKSAIKYLMEHTEQFRLHLDIFGMRHAEGKVEQVRNSKGETFDTVWQKRTDYCPLGTTSDPRNWPVEKEEAKFARECSKMSVSELEKVFKSLISGKDAPIKPGTLFLKEPSPLVAFLDELSSSPSQIDHYFRYPSYIINSLKSIRKSRSLLAKEQKTKHAEWLANAYKYKAFLRELMIRWN